jgi:hypothetical protein
VPSYSFRIRKADHVEADGQAELHVHVSYNQGQSRRLLGRYRLPTLSPVFPKEPELNQTEMRLLRDWLAQPDQVRKLENCLRDSVFNLHQMGDLAARLGQVVSQEGETFITVRIPVGRRL